MISMLIDRCYDRYIVSVEKDVFSLPDPREDETASRVRERAEALMDTLCAVLESYASHGRLRQYRLTREEDGLSVDVEAAAGQEDYLAAAIDTVAEGMCLLAERYPALVSAEI